jgi:NAD(P)-dependent dehydrogenase (short-subunit alcohol dehydrogenase family)
VTALAACASTPINYEGLASASQLQKNPHGQGEVPLLYKAPGVNLARYSAVILDPVTIYSGPDAQFDTTFRKAGPEGRKTIANYMEQQFAAKLATKYALVQAAAPDAMRVHVTLTGAESNTPVMSVVSMAPPYGTVISALVTVMGQQGQFCGSVTYAVEVRDSETNTLLQAFVSKRYPWAVNPLDSFGSYAAAKAGVRKGADALLAQLEH